jgi:4-hydroxybenzoate polyprenyltransferase
MRLREALELCRAPNVFTAPADVAMGVAISGAPLSPRVVLLLVASALAYAGGMALNDVCDADLDALERPERPIPSARVTRAAALALAAALLLGCLTLAGLSGPRPLGAAAALVLLIVVYDRFAKRTALGPVAMASCRVLDAGLGISLGCVSAGALAPAAVLFCYVLILTIVSRFEVVRAPRLLVRAARALFLLLGLSAAALALAPPLGHARLTAAALLGALFAWLGLPLEAAGRDPSPSHIIAVVKAGVLGIVLLDAAFAAGARGPWFGLCVAVLFLPSYILGRRFASA